MEKEQSVSVLWRNLLDMNRQLKHTLQVMNGKTSLSSSAMAVIFQLEHQPQMKMNDVAEYLCITVGAATSLVDKLEQLSWVERIRSKEDRRIIYVELTEAGKQQLLAMRNQFIGQAVTIFQPLPAEKLAQMADELKTLETYLAAYNRLTEGK